MWVTQVLEIERIRTGDINEAAITAQKVEHVLHDNYYSHEDTPST